MPTLFSDYDDDGAVLWTRVIVSLGSTYVWGLCTQTPIRKVTVEKDPARPALELLPRIPTC